ncbi:hypothetical protein EN935_05510 [Mesorhizobium sp. M7D.F.Ca.US.004.03.1.1]|nr:hypothetical protein EN935_05510 [Mesorhizobium sp. M7D.F.Ca.US.004.03.1.1]
MEDPNVTWYGDLARNAIKGARRYMLFGPRQILGYKYSIGMQMGLCHGPADAMFEIRAGGKMAFQGVSPGGRITINKPDLFGGDQSEGGIVGDVDLEMGAPDQLQNDYLVGVLGEDVSAYRGVFTVVLRRVYLGTSAYIKAWAFRLQRILLRSDGSPQWYAEKAAIQSEILDFTKGDPGLDLGTQNGSGDGGWDTSGDYVTWSNLDTIRIWTLPTGTLRTIPISQGVAIGHPVAMAGEDQVVSRQGELIGSDTFLKFYSASTGSLEQTLPLTTSSDGAVNYNSGFRMVDLEVDGDRYAMVLLEAFALMWVLIKKTGSWSIEWKHSGTEPVRTLAMGKSFFYGVPDETAPTEIVMIPWTAAFAENRVTPPGLTASIRNCSYLEDTDEVLIVCANSDLFVYTPDLATMKRMSSGNPDMGGVGSLSAKRINLGPGRIGLYSNSSVKRVYAILVHDLSIDYTIKVEETNFVDKAGFQPSQPPYGFNAKHGGLLIPGSSVKSVFWFVASTIAFDMNPAHIIRECLTDATWGMGYHDGDIDDESFRAAADTFYAERFGLSLKWYREEQIQEFVTVIQSHADAYVFLSRTTGKYKLKPIRKDYDIDTIRVVTEDDVVEWTEVVRRQPAEAVSSVNVKFYDRASRKDGSHIVTNNAQAMQAQEVIQATREYPGINTRELAVRAGTRDVLSLGAGMASGRLKVKRTLEDMEPGEPFRLVSERHGLSGEVMRAVDPGFGDGRSNAIGLKFLQDVFNLGAAVMADSSGSDWENPSSAPAPASPRLVWEMPYRELRQMVGDVQLAATLAADPDAGLMQVAATRPSADAANAVINVDAGSGFTDVDTLDFAPGGFLAAALAIDDTEIVVITAHDLDDVAIGSLAAIVGPSPQATEVVRIDAVDGGTMTIARGCLDTVPQAHDAGRAIVFFDDFSLSDFETYSAADTVSVKLLTTTGLGTLERSAAPTDSVVMDSRAIRPLRPANVTVEGDRYGPVDAPSLSEFLVEWATRNRLTEMTPLGWTDASVDPEAGATAIIEVLDPTGATVVTTHSGLSGTDYTVPIASFGGNMSGFIRVGAERDGHREWQAHQIEVLVGNELVLDGVPLTLGGEILFLGA